MYVLAEFSDKGIFQCLMVSITKEVRVFQTLDEAQGARENAMIPSGSRVKIMILNEVDEG